MGKSTVAAWFKRCGVRVHDSDECVHRLYASGGAAVAPVLERFPKAVAGDGGVDRKLLSAEVVAAGREESLKTLEKIVHPLVEADRADWQPVAYSTGEIRGQATRQMRARRRLRRGARRGRRAVGQLRLRELALPWPGP